MSAASNTEARVGVLVDCDNVQPEILEHALRVMAQFGRVVLRRGYGNSSTLAHRWQEALVHLGFTPCLQYQYSAGKNTADIALALDALEALFDDRVDNFCLVTSDSDFAYLCRKLRERGATVCIVGEEKTPKALRNASDQFFEWRPAKSVEELELTPSNKSQEKSCAPAKPEPPRLEAAKPLPKRRPRSVIEAVSLLASDTAEGKVQLATLGQYLRRSDPAFSPQACGHSGLLNMIKTYDLLMLSQESNGQWFVSPVSKVDAHETGEAEAAQVPI